MDLHFDTEAAEKYSSNSQKIRVLSENWVSKQAYCPNCGHILTEYENNRPVADFFCPNCAEEYELKSKSKSIGSKVVDGAYQSMLGRLQSSTNPNLLLLSYSLPIHSVNNFVVVPKHFFVPEIIERRKPLAMTARRAGWIGCNINLQNVPASGKIFFVKNGQWQPKDSVIAAWQKTLFLRDQQDISERSWIVDTMNCIEKINKTEFSLTELYGYEELLGQKHPHNRHIKDKIRQQLQLLRDQGYLDFLGQGNYQLK